MCFYSKIKIDDAFFYCLMNNKDVFPLFIYAYDFVKSNIGKSILESFYQSNKRTEEECGLKFYRGSKKIYVGALYIWRMRSSRIYYIGWWIDNDHKDLFFKNSKDKLSWKKKVKPVLKTPSISKQNKVSKAKSKVTKAKSKVRPIYLK